MFLINKHSPLAVLSAKWGCDRIDVFLYYLFGWKSWWVAVTSKEAVLPRKHCRIPHLGHERLCGDRVDAAGTPGSAPLLGFTLSPVLTVLYTACLAQEVPSSKPEGGGRGQVLLFVFKMWNVQLLVLLYYAYDWGHTLDSFSILAIVIDTWKKPSWVKICFLLKEMTIKTKNWSKCYHSISVIPLL